MEISAASSGGYSTPFASMGGSGRRKPSAEDLASKMMEELDRDGDGGLAVGETPLEEDAFQKVDADGDGKISSEELTAGIKSKSDKLKSLMPQPPVGAFGPGTASQDFLARMTQDVIKTKDTDGDGVLTAEETGLSGEVYSKLDTDGDGALSAAELQAGFANRAEGTEQLLPPPPDGGQGQTMGQGPGQGGQSMSRSAMSRGVAAYQLRMSDLMNSLFGDGPALSGPDASTSLNAAV